MAENKVRFLRGTAAEYANAVKDDDTFYYTTDDEKFYVGSKEITGGGITVDSELSDTSTNPVYNKVIKAALDEKADKTVATTTADGLMSAEDKTKLDGADNTYALKSKYGDTTIDVGRMDGSVVGYYSTAEGKYTTASEAYSHAEGSVTIASGFCSHAEGSSTTASGSCSHAGGRYTNALHDYEVAYGLYNESNDDTLFSIGDGTSDSARHNAFEITTTGGKLHDKDIATDVSNPNLLINPDFKINQRGVSGTFSETGKYFVDRWNLTSGTVTVNADGTLTLNGTISQIFENAVGTNVVASASAGTAVYDNSTKTFSITANGETVSWAKLEYGSTATAFVVPDPTTELLKCKRYYEVINRACRALSPTDVWIEGMVFDVPKRVIPDISITSSAGTPNTLSNYMGADSNITLSGMPNVGFDRIHGSPCNQAIGTSSYNYTCKADAEIY